MASLPGDLLTAVLRPSAGAHKSVRLVCRHFRDAFDAGVTRATLQLQPMALRGERSLPPVPRCAPVARLDTSDLAVWGLDKVGAADVYAVLRTWCCDVATDAAHAVSATSSTNIGMRTWPPLELDLSGANAFLFRTHGVNGVQQFTNMLRDPAFAPGGLQVLDLSNAFVANTTAIFAALPVAPLLSALRELRLRNITQRVMEEGEAASLCRALTAATQLRSLTLLDLSDNDLGREGTAALASALSDASHLSTLQHLALVSARLHSTDVLAGAVAGLQLTWLDVSGNSIGDEGAAGWADALARSTRLGNLQHLDIGNNYNNILTDAGLLTLSAALQTATHITNLRRLVLSPNKGSPARITQLLAAAPHLAASLEVLSLRFVDLDDGAVVDELAAPLVAGLQLPRLTCLDLSWCWFGSGDGLLRACAMLRTATQLSGLQELDISGSHLRSEAQCSAVTAMLAAATHLSSLRAVFLGNGPLAGPEVFVSLLRAAPHLRGLTRLPMDCELLTATGVAQLCEALALLPRLRRLCLTKVPGRVLRQAGLDAQVAAVQGAPCLHELRELTLSFICAGLSRGADPQLDAMLARKVGALVACTRLSSLQSLQLGFGASPADAVCEALGDALVGARHLSGLRQLHLHLNTYQRQPSAALHELHELQRRLVASHLGANVTLRFT